jgi:hypothetical protein
MNPPHVKFWKSSCHRPSLRIWEEMRTNLVLAVVAIALVPAVIATLPFLGLMSISTNSPPWNGTSWTIPWAEAWALSFTLTPGLLYIAISSRLASVGRALLATIEVLLYLGGLFAFLSGLWFNILINPGVLAALTCCLGAILVRRRGAAAVPTGDHSMKIVSRRQ